MGLATAPLPIPSVKNACGAEISALDTRNSAKLGHSLGVYQIGEEYARS